MSHPEAAFIRGLSSAVAIVDLRDAEEFEAVRLLSRLDIIAASSNSDACPLASTAAAGEAVDLDASGYANLELTIVNIPFESLDSRCIELPPRNVEFDVIYPDTDNDEVFNYFNQTVRPSSGTSQKPWAVRNSVIGSRSFFDKCRMGISACDGSFITKVVGVIEDVKSVRPGPRLWRPDTMVESLLFPLLRGKLSVIQQTSQQSAEAHRLYVMDLGCGAGRDVAFLAEEASKVWSLTNSSMALDEVLSVVGIDSHKKTFKRCNPLWESRGVSRITRLERLNLKNEVEFDSLVARLGGAVDLMYSVRFLSRSLVSRISRGSYVRPGGHFLMSHFITESDGSFPYDHPTIHDVLELGELERAFGVYCGNSDIDSTDSKAKPGEQDDDQEAAPSGWRLVQSIIVRDNDFGRPLCQFCVQKV